MGFKILVVNPGSTSTKIAVYENEKELFFNTFDYTAEELKRFKRVYEQFEMRKKDIVNYLDEQAFKLEELSAVVGRGGILTPVKSGAYKVNSSMLDRLIYNPVMEHASNLGGIIAYEIAKPLGINAYIYDSVAVDELEAIARISGLPEIPRTSFSHALNSRVAAIKFAYRNGKEYEDLNIIVAHLGGGISISIHNKGRMIDVIPDYEGPLSPERAGAVPSIKLVDLCYSRKYDKETIYRMLRGDGGLKAYLGTHDAREIEKMISNGSEEAKLVYQAMAYQISKSIGELAPVVNGKVDVIILTGGLAYSEMLTSWIKRRVEFIAPVEIMAGENEMEALALGVLRVLRGEEDANEYEEIYD